jgi:hypothetical protein
MNAGATQICSPLPSHNPQVTNLISAILVFMPVGVDCLEDDHGKQNNYDCEQPH